MNDPELRDRSPLDLEMIQELRALDSRGVPFLSALIGHFVEKSRLDLAEITDSIDAADPERVWRLAHGLKGSSHMVGAYRLAEAAARLERASRERDFGEASSQLPALEREHAVACEALRALISRRGRG